MTGSELLDFIGPIIVGAMTVGGVVYTNNATRKKIDAVRDMQLQQINSNIERLEKAQQKHNSVIERTFLLEKAQEAQTRDIKTLYNTVDEVKKDIKEVHSEVDIMNKNLANVRECEIRLEEKLK